MAAQAVERHPVSAQRIATETGHDKTLSKALQLTQEGWNMSQCENPELKPYFCRKYELTPGVSRMKTMARAHFWWPNLDDDISKLAQSCNDCNRVRANPPKAPLQPWIWPSRPWQRIHIDFATYNNQHYLIMVDAYSKWPEVIGPMRSTNADATTSAMRNIFSRYGIPDQVVSDRGPPFQSADYEDFLRKNAAQRVLVSPYHQSRGQVERFIQTLKRFLETSRTQPNLLSKIPNFLLTYRSTPHATTGTSPAKLFLGREVTTRLSIMKPDIASRVAVRNETPS